MLFPLAILALSCTPTITAEQVAKRASERVARDATSATPISLIKEWSEADLDDTKAEHSKRWRVAGQGTRVTQTLVAQDGRSVSGTPENKPFDMRRQLIDRYDWSLAMPCPQESEGRTYWVISFRPRTSGVLPLGDEEDELLNHITGLLYVDTETWMIRKAEGKLIKEYDTHIIGHVRSAELELSQQEVDGVAVPEVISITVRYRKLFFRYAKRILYRYRNAMPEVSPTPLQ